MDACAIASYETAREWAPFGVASDLWFSRSLVEAASRAGVGASLPIFQGFGRSAKIAESRRALRQTELAELDATRKVALQVREAYHACKAADEKVAAAETMVAQASKFREITTAARSSSNRAAPRWQGHRAGRGRRGLQLIRRYLRKRAD